MSGCEWSGVAGSARAADTQVLPPRPRALEPPALCGSQGDVSEAVRQDTAEARRGRGESGGVEERVVQAMGTEMETETETELMRRRRASTSARWLLSLSRIEDRMIPNDVREAIVVGWTECWGLCGIMLTC
jgi:hypothetical protein